MFHILIPDAENENCLFEGVLLSLSAKGNVRLYVISEDKSSAVQYSRFVKKYIHRSGQESDEEWISLINKTIKKYKINVIFPLDVIATARLIRLRNKIIRPQAFLGVQDLSNYLLASNKLKLSEFLEKNQYPHPTSYPLNFDSDWKAQIKKMVFPIIMKPAVKSGFGNGILKFDSEAEFISHLEANPPQIPYIYERFISGLEMGCNVLCKEGQILAHTMQKGFLFSNEDFSPQVAMDFVENEQVYLQISRLFKQLNWSGLANVDLIYDPITEKYLILEINPRPWSTILGSAAAGVNFPWLYCETVAKKPFQRPEPKPIQYYTRKGLILSVKRNPWVIFKKKALWQNSPLRYYLNDPIFKSLEIIRMIRNLMKPLVPTKIRI